MSQQLPRLLLAHLAVGVLFTYVGCSQGNGGPAAPLPPTGAEAPIPEGSGLVAGGSEAAWNVLGGVYELNLSLGDTPTATITPQRMAAAKGDAYAVDATGFLRTSPCTDCLQVVGLERGGQPDEVNVRFALRHPFELPTQPFTQASRLDLHAFDVMGYLLSPGTDGFLALGDGDTAATPFLMNADGYSDLYDLATEPFYATPNVSEHPYRLFFNDDTAGNFTGSATNGFADPAAPAGHNVMAQGSPFSETTYTLRIPGSGQVSIGFAIGLAWGQPAQGRGSLLGQRQNPVYYLPEFHHKAAWKLTAALSNNNLTAGVTTSNAQLDIQLRDWQLEGVVDPGWEFGVSDRAALKGSSDVASLSVHVPGLLAAPLSIDPASGTGTGVLEDRTFSTIIPNSLGAAGGTYYAYIKAVDSRTPDGTSVIDRTIDFVSIPAFHTGTIVEVEVSAPMNPPVAALLPTSLGFACLPSLPTELDASASSDIDGGVLMFEWDFNLPTGDPLNFVADAGPSTEATIMHSFEAPLGTHYAVRVTDNTGLSDIATGTLQQLSPGLQPPVSISPHVSPTVQQFPYAVDSGGPVLAQAGGFTFLATNTWTSSNPAGNHIRVWRTTDGTSWTPMPSLDMGNPFYNMTWDYSIAAGSDGSLYVINAISNGSNYGTNWETRISRNTSFGTGTWSTVHTDATLGQRTYAYMFVDPTNPNLVLAYDYINSSGGRFYRSTTGAAGPFTTIPASVARMGMNIQRLPNGDFGFLGAFSNNLEARRSTDQGQSFPLVGSYALNTPGGSGLQGCSGAINPDGTDWVFAYHLNNLDGLRVVRSTDAGANWAPGALDVAPAPSPAFTGAPQTWAMVDLVFTNSDALHLTFFHAYWGPAGVNKGYHVTSTDYGNTFTTPTLLYDCGSTPSWPGMGLCVLPNGSDAMAVMSRLQNLESRNIPGC